MKKSNYRYAAEVTQRLYDLEQGWGLVNVKESVSPAPGKTTYIDFSDTLRTGESSVFEIELNDSDIPLKVAMVYSDYPGTFLINNLNIIVTDPNGKRYHGIFYSISYLYAV